MTNNSERYDNASNYRIQALRDGKDVLNEQSHFDQQHTQRDEVVTIYGTISAIDKKLRICDRTTERPGVTENGRNRNRGLACQFWRKAALIEVLWKLKIEYIGGYTQVTESRAELIDYLVGAGAQTKDRIVSDFSDEKLRFFFVWYRTGMNRSQIGEILQDELQKMDRLFIM